MTGTGARRVRVVVDGKAYVVEVGDLQASPVVVTVNGRRFLVEVEGVMTEPPLGDVLPPAPETVHRETSAPLKAPAPAVPAGPSVPRVLAPMPGNVLDIRVKPGERVRFKQILCFLDAMKMKTAICSPRDGVIAQVDVTDGQTVAHGDVLFSFE